MRRIYYRETVFFTRQDRSGAAPKLSLVIILFIFKGLPFGTKRKFTIGMEAAVQPKLEVSMMATLKSNNGKESCMKHRKHGQDASGFTVLELLVSLSIAGVLTAIAVPGFLSWLPTLRLSSAARQLTTDLQVARMRAITQNSSNTVSFNATDGTYSFSLGVESRNLNDLYPGTSIISVSPSNPVFYPRGTANAGITITLSNGGAQKVVCVKTVGRVNIADTSCA